MLNTLINIFAAPAEAFRSLREKPTFLVPLLLIALLSASVQYGYYQVVERDFLIDQLVEQTQRVVNIPEDQLRAGFENASPNRFAVQSIISVLIFIPLMMCLFAGYLSLITKFTYAEVRFRQWFAMVTWSGMPAVLVAIAGWVVLLSSSDGMIGLQQINPLSLNNLIFQTDGDYAGLLSGIDLTQIWSLVLMVLGYRQWTGKSTLQSVLVIVTPYAIILGIIITVIAL